MKHCNIGSMGFKSCVLGLVVLILTSFLSVPPVSAQQAASSQRQVFLSLEEAIGLALQNNLEISIEQYNPEIQREEITNAEAAFDHTLSSAGSQTFAESTTSTSQAESTTGIQFGLNKRFTTGGTYGLELQTSRSGFDDATEIDDVYATSVDLTVGQALLKNRGIQVNTTPILIARKSRDISLSELRTTVIDIVSQVKNTYWNLVFQRGDLEAKRLSLELAYDLVKINEAQVEVGTLAPIEVLQAQATAASREVDIISAELSVQNTEDELKRLLNFPDDDPVWTASIIPTDAPVAERQPISLDESIQLALDNREELKQIQKSLEIRNLSLNLAENQLLPSLDLQGQVGLTGQDENWGGAFSETPNFDDYDLTVSLSFSYPLGNNAAESAFNQAKLEFDQTRLSIQNLEQVITVQVRQAVRAVETALKTVEATKVARQLAEEQLGAEEKKFREGLSTNFQVLDYQDKLATAQSRETQAMTGYNQALVGLDQATGLTLQRHNIVVNE
ncbi:hypothetical protein GF339_16715 [candidate division KSB3 bacterium]|uniref:Transporter n=1 Tax=candidate division KSB3 bacterium TaxID=2044937 RepID=A0A9D5Q7F0_9BACT|nr:hypothetical protein [candidate division KSB3 bacterium]MBD3326232.1 hypothetical protein [candidate division KSB3 bacterium]